MKVFSTNQEQNSVIGHQLRRISFCWGLVFALSLLPGCSQLIANDEDVQPKLTTTGLAAATGAALGAGVGAVVGSTTGSAGGGLVIGAAAGATAGGLVGHELEEQENAIKNQEEALARHELKISEQERQIQELREGAKDRPALPSRIPDMRQGAVKHFEIPAANRPSSYRRANGKSFAKANLVPVSRESVLAGAEKREQARMRLGSEPQKAWAGTSSEAPALREIPKTAAAGTAAKPLAMIESPEPVKPALPPAAVKSPAASELPPARVVADDTPAAESAVSPAAEEEKTPGGGEAPAQTAKVATSEGSATRINSSSCQAAEAEASRARNASSDADKLFYYRRAIRLCPRQPAYHIEMGKVYSGLGRAVEARTEFEKALEIDPESASAQEELSMLKLDNSY